jgi:hypothetical protein
MGIAFEEPIARIWSRCCCENDGLFVGTMLQQHHGLLEENTIYELVKNELTGDILLRKKGPSTVIPSGGGSPILNILKNYTRIHHIAESFEDVVLNKLTFLTLNETIDYVKNQLMEIISEGTVNDYDSGQFILLDLIFFAHKNW